MVLGVGVLVQYPTTVSSGVSAAALLLVQ